MRCPKLGRTRRIALAIVGVWMTSIVAFALLANADTPPPDDWDFFTFLPAVSALFSPTPAPTPTPMPPLDFSELGIHGVNVQAVTESGGFVPLDRADATWIRPLPLRWADVEPQPGLRNWSAIWKLEADLVTAAISGHTTMLIVSATPSWAQQIPGYECGPIRTDAFDDFGRFLVDTVKRYSGPPYNVMVWEIWNEPDISTTLVAPNSAFGCWGDEADDYYGGRYYGEMLAVVYPMMKLENPNIEVMVGGLLMDCDVAFCKSKTSKFFEGILVGHGGDFFDGVSFHAYDYYVGDEGKYVNPGWNSSWEVDGPVLIRKARYLVRLMETYGVTGKFLADTELALLCPFGCDTVFEESKAGYLTQAYAAALAENLVGNIWYDMRGGWRSSSLLYADRTPRPAYYAFQFSAAVLNDAEYVGEIPPSFGLAGYIFARPNADLWLIWSKKAAAQTIQLPRDPARIYDIYGNTLPVSTTLTVGWKPIYVEFGR